MRHGVDRPRIGLALGGGGARGAAHVGVLRGLEAAGIPIDCIAGTSSGAMVGAAYAAGVTVDQIEAIFRSVRMRDLFRPSWRLDGWLDNSPLAASFERTVGRLRIEDLPIPFAAMATDADSGEAVPLQEGELGPILRASTAIPCIVRPVHLAGRRLVDGGVTNKVPVRLARSMGADLVIAVDLSIPYPWRRRQARSPLHFLMRVLEIMDEQLVSTQLAEADVVIQPPVDCGNFEFHRYRQQVVSGEEAVAGAIPLIRKRMSAFAASAGQRYAETRPAPGAVPVPALIAQPAPLLE